MSKRNVVIASLALALLCVLVGAGYVFRDTILGNVVGDAENSKLRDVSATTIEVSTRELYGEDWLEYDDAEENIEAISEQIAEFVEAAKELDKKEVASYFDDSVRDIYQEAIESDEEKLEVLADIMSNMNIVYISNSTMSENAYTSSPRYAYAEVMYNDYVYTIVLVESDGQWLIQSL